jgi:DNA polymerase IV
MSEMERIVVHLDLDAFFAAVEVLEDPALAGKPLIVGGRPEERGVVASASYEARARGVRSAMPTYRALALCPEAVVRPARHGVYGGYSRRVMAILEEAAPLVEQMSIDEACFELTGHVDDWQAGVEIARLVQRRVRDEVGLSASLGVATNKLVAKVASDRDKPGGLTVVRPGEEAAFLAPLPVRVLWGVGPVTAQRLAELGVETVADLRRLDPAELAARFGSHGLHLGQQAQGLDDRPLSTDHEIKSVSQETTFARDVVQPEALHAHLHELSQGVARRLRRRELAAGTVAIKLRYADFSTVTRQMALAVPTDDGEVIYRAALVLLQRTWRRGRPVRLLGVAGQRLSAPAGQLSLF